MPKYNSKLTSGDPKFTSKSLAEKINEGKISFSFQFFSQKNNFGLKGSSF